MFMVAPAFANSALITKLLRPHTCRRPEAEQDLDVLAVACAQLDFAGLN